MTIKEQRADEVNLLTFYRLLTKKNRKKLIGVICTFVAEQNANGEEAERIELPKGNQADASTYYW